LYLIKFFILFDFSENYILLSTEEVGSTSDNTG